MTARVLKQDPNTEKVQKNAYVLGQKYNQLFITTIWRLCVGPNKIVAFF